MGGLSGGGKAKAGHDEIFIESVDLNGRMSFRAISEGAGAAGGIKWKRKSELSNPESALSGKSRISIKAVNK